MDVVDNKVLSRSDFIRIDLDPVPYYCSFRSDDIEICLGPCAGGFCVAAYNEDETQLDALIVFYNAIYLQFMIIPFLE